MSEKHATTTKFPYHVDSDAMIDAVRRSQALHPPYKNLADGANIPLSRRDELVLRLAMADPNWQYIIQRKEVIRDAVHTADLMLDALDKQDVEEGDE